MTTCMIRSAMDVPFSNEQPTGFPHPYFGPVLSGPPGGESPSVYSTHGMFLVEFAIRNGLLSSLMRTGGR